MYTNSRNSALRLLSEMTKSAGALLLLIMPKCSLCLAAYLNIFTLMGLSVSKYARWLFPLLCAVVILNIIVSFLKARNLNDFRAFGLSIAGIALLISDKIFFNKAYIGWLGLVLIVGSTMLQLVQSRKVCNQELIRQKPELEKNTGFL